MVYKLYLPMQDNNGNDLTGLVNATILEVLKVFEGCTSYDGAGYWMDKGDDNRLYIDNVTIVEIYVSVDSGVNGAIIESIMRDYGKEAKQKSVLYARNNRSILIELE